MLLDLVQPFLRAAVSLDLAEISIPWYIVSITLHPARFGFFTGPSSIVPSLHWQKVWIFKLFAPLASFSYATWSSATFLASCSEPRTCWNLYTLMVSITWESLGLGLFTAPSTIVPSLHRLKRSIFKPFTPDALTLMVSITWQSAGLGLFQKARVGEKEGLFSTCKGDRTRILHTPRPFSKWRPCQGSN